MANRDLTQDERETLEGLVDSANLGAVLMALSEICSEKAEHIRHAWQDGVTGRAWDIAAGHVGIAAATVDHKLHI